MEVFSLVLFKLVEWLILTLFANCFYKLAMNMRGYYYSPTLLSFSHKPSFSTPNPTLLTTLNKTHVNNFKSSANTTQNTIVCDINGALLKTSSFFPFFMLFAFEAGSIIRAFLLLLSYPFCCLISSHGFKLKVMVFITFFGMRVEAVESVARTVLPKFYLEEINPLVYEMWGSARGKVVISSVPRVMVDWFCREYLSASKVLATELHTINFCNNGLFFSGLLKSSYEKHRKVKEEFGDAKLDVGIFGIQSCVHDNLLLSLCKEAYAVSKDSGNQNFPRKKYPKPLIFHDGRLAFLPTPAAAFTAFLYLPFAVPLSLLRLLIGTLLPFPVATLLNSFSGMRLLYTTAAATCLSRRHVLYVSNHRTLVDPVFLSFALRKPLTAVTYSLSRLSELLSPIPTVRLTRNRTHDAAAMKKLLSKGDLVVCPEGTTCREPYLLRFSSLFAELTDEIVPVAVEADVSMFYGTTASGLKWLDPVLFLMNPRPGYSVKVLAKVPPEMTCGGGGRSGVEVANYVQKEVAATLGFECTGFTRKDKYLMLAGNDGFVAADAAAAAAGNN